MSTTLTQTTESTTETTVSTAAPAAKRKPNMATPRKKKTSTIVATPFSLSEKRQEATVIKNKVVMGEYNYFTGLTDGFMISVRQLYPKASFGKAEYAMALAVMFGTPAGGAHKASPAAISGWLADSYRTGTQPVVIKTLYAAISGVPQEGMDAKVAPHLDEFHKHYAANWAAYLGTPEGKALRGGTAAVSIPTQTPGFGMGVGAAVAKAAGGQQALTVAQQIEAAEGRARRALAQAEAMKRANLGE